MENNIDSIFNSVAAKKIKYYREKKGYSLEEVVSKMKNPVSRQMLYKYENNLARMKNSIFNDICSALGVNPIQVMQEINRETNAMARDIYSISNEPTFSTMINPITGDTELILHINANELKNVEVKKSSEKDIANIKERMQQCGIEDVQKSDELEVLFDKHKDILTEDDKKYIKFIIEERKKEIDKELGEDNQG